MRTTCVLLVVAALAMPLGAAAKGEITRLRVCGASQCRIVSDRSAVHAVFLAIVNRAQNRKAPPPSSFFTIRPERTQEWPTAWPRYVYVPAAGMLRLQSDRRGTAEWSWLGRRDPALRRITRRLRPFPASGFPTGAR